ncbi:RHS repeat-associated core domain-containing protein [Corallococcus sp. RDP092CA]|uniref:RHS repeat-associated core domain-containing protein n=1 Tax=Corallococcus sp. RDP092CA TaxID=3109369 RepID=UPI0035B1F1A1
MVVVLVLLGAWGARAEGDVSGWQSRVSSLGKTLLHEDFSPSKRSCEVIPTDQTQAFEAARLAWEAKRDAPQEQLAQSLERARAELGDGPGWWARFWHAPVAGDAEKISLERSRDELLRAKQLLRKVELAGEADQARRQRLLLAIEQQVDLLETLRDGVFSRAWEMALGRFPQEGMAQLREGLSRLDADVVVEDVTQVANIEKVVMTDLQEGLVGQPLAQPVAVRVTTVNGDPVSGAVVTFKRALGSQPGFLPVGGAGQAQAQLQATTDENGLAAVRVVPDTNIARSSFLREGPHSPQRLGYNAVTAETSNGTKTFALAAPFVEVGLPDVPAQIQTFYVPPTTEAGLQMIAPFSGKVSDQYGNALANQLVTWSQSPATGRFFRYQDSATPQVLNVSNPMQLQTLQEWTDVDGWMSAGYIPGTTAGYYAVMASVGGLSQPFGVSAFIPTARYTLRGTYNGDFNGVYQTTGPQVLTLQILRWPVGAPGWVPVRGDEPGLVDVLVGAFTYSDNGILLDTFVAAPVWTSSEPLDDEYSMAFRPRYLVREGYQRVYFAAQGYELDANGEDVEVCCGQELYIRHYSTVPTLSARRQLYGGTVVAAGGQAETSDSGLGFYVINRSSDNLYVRTTIQPNVPGDDVLVFAANVPRDVDGDIVLPASSNFQRILPLAVGTQGGRVRFELFAKNYSSTSTVKVLQSAEEVEVLPPEPGLLIAGLPLRARWVLPVWDFVSARKVTPGEPPPDDAQVPIAYGAPLGVKVFGNGRLEVRRGQTEIASAQVLANATGITQVSWLGGAAIALGQGGIAVMEIPPGTVGQETVRVTLIPDNPNQTSLNQEVVLTTSVGTVGRLPVGHTFVKGVSVVDGHLVKQAVDVESPSRGLGLSWQRAYASGDSDEGVLGLGWTHAYEGAVQPLLGGGFRYAVTSGEGGGQVFTCTGEGTECVAQRGYHGTLRVEGVGAAREYIFRAKDGTEYRHGRLDSASFPVKYRLTSVVAPTGHRVLMRYGDASVDGALTRVFDEASGRLLELGHVRESGHLRLRTVELHHATSVDAMSTTFLNVCVQYAYDTQQRLVSVSRYDGACSSGTPLRTESYAYEDGVLEAGRTRLNRYTGPEGEVTRYTYYGATESMPGEDDFLLLMSKDERVKQVVEVMETAPVREAITSFTYSIAPDTRTVLGQSLTTYRTSVKGPRAGVPETHYWMMATGAVVETEKPLSTGVVARTSALWDSVHRVREAELDARGRVTHLAYDARGNLVERRIGGAALPAMGTVAATLPVLDGQGQPVSEVVEKWGYEASFNAQVCHVDAEGYATVSRVDSSGDAPEDVLPTGTGRQLETRRYVNRVPRPVLTSAATCEEAVASLQESPQDVVLSWRYCGVEGAACPSLAVTGDWVESVGADGHREKATAYDAYGQLRTKTLQVSGAATVTVQTLYDARGRLEDEQDGLGRHRIQQWDGLDRVKREEWVNPHGEGQVRTALYYPGGELQYETLGGDFIREHWLDAAGRRARTVESGGGLTASLETRYAYDDAGNRTMVIDRRGVLTTTVYDFADRPVEMLVSVADASRFVAQGGNTGDVSRTYTLSHVTYDAAGNKVAEEDLSGFDRHYRLDSLYRAVEEQSPEVRGADLDAPPVRYTQTFAYDLTGHRVRQVDGNGHAQTAEYDLLGRATVQTDAVGRVERREYDGRGNVTEARWEAGGVQHRKQTTTYDGLSRVLSVTERVATKAGEAVYTTQTVHDDMAHVEWTRDARGFVQARHLDGLGRIFKGQEDAANGPLSRQPDDPRVGPALNLVYTVEYDRYGHESARVDALGRRTETVHDALGRLSDVYRPMGVSESQTHDGEGHVIRSIDGRGVERGFTYDALGRLRTETLVESLSKGGQSLTVSERTYVDAPDTEALTREQVRDARGQLTVTYRDGLRRVVRRTDAAGYASDTWFDALYKRVEKNAKGHLTRFAYDAAGRVLSQSEAASVSGPAAYGQSWQYGDATRELTHWDRRQVPTVQRADGLGRKVYSSRGQGQDVAEESWTYNAAGQVARAVDANGYATTRLYDGAARLVEETQGAGSPEAATTAFQYDAAGQLMQKKGPRATGVLFDARYTYDDLGRRVREEDALGHVTAWAYDAAGNRVCMKEPLGAPAISHGDAAGLTLAEVEEQVCTDTYVTWYAYDEQGKLLSVTDAAGGLTSYVYDAARNLVAKQDANGNLTTYEYDVRNLRTAEHQHLDSHARLTAAQRSQVPLFEAGATPSGSVGTLTWRHTYDANGNPSSMTDPKGQVTVSGYGLLDRLASRTYSQHAQPRELPSVDAEGFAYDGNGNLGRATLLKQTLGGVVEEATTYTYDALDRVKTRLREQDGKQLSFEYDAMGHRTSVTDADGVVTGYAYDALGRLMQATLPAGVVEYRYWPDSLLKGVVWPNGLSEGRCYDAAGRLVDLVTARGTVSDSCQTSGPVISRFGYTYDANGNRLTQVETRTSSSTQVLGGNETTRYGYDVLNRLTGVAEPDFLNTLYRLDAVGNRTGERQARVRRERGLGPDAYSSVEPKALTRDVTGTFNRVDWLRGLEDARGAKLNTVLTYDLVGNLVEKATQNGTRTFAWDIRNTLTAAYDNGQDVGRYDYDNDLQRTQRNTASEDVAYVLDDGFILQELDGAQATHPSKRRYHYGGGPLAVSEVASAATNFLGTDALGSVTDALSTSGTVTVARRYDAWGGPRSGSAPTASEFKLGYTGHQYDVETGLTYARARYYDSELGRFISRDSYEGQLSDAPSLHRYTYAYGNPFSYRDDDGHSATAVGTALGFAWGVGQAIGAGGNDLLWGQRRSFGDYASIVAQNTIGGAELGLSIDATVLSGGTGYLVGGALGNAGFDSLTFDGSAKKWQQHADDQVIEGTKGAVLGYGLGKALPVVGAGAVWVTSKVPGGRAAIERVVTLGGRALNAAASSLPKAELGMLGSAANPFTRFASSAETAVVEGASTSGTRLVEMPSHAGPIDPVVDSDVLVKAWNAQRGSVRPADEAALDLLRDPNYQWVVTPTTYSEFTTVATGSASRRRFLSSFENLEVLAGERAAILRTGEKFEAAFELLRDAANRSRAGQGDRAVTGGMKSHFNDIVNASYSKELGIPYVTADGKFIRFLGQHGRKAEIDGRHFLEFLKKGPTQ